MNPRTLLFLSVGLLVGICLAIVICAIEPIALKLRIEGGWLFFWPLLFYFIRFATYFVIPPVAVLLAALAYPLKSRLSRWTWITLGLVLVCTAMLILVVWALDSWHRAEANHIYEQRFGTIPPSEILNRSVVGQTLPAVPLRTFDGRSVEVGQYIRDKKIGVLVFWCSYDAPWSPNMDIAQQLNRTFANQGVIVIGINELDSEESAKAFVAKKRVEFPVLRDTERQYFKALGVIGSVEQILVVDSTGRILQHLPKVPNSSEQLSELIQSDLRRTQ